MNSVKYSFADFTHSMYSEFLRTALEKYSFANFSNFLDIQNPLLLRHDVDFSIASALEMAKIENKLKEMSTVLDAHL